MCPRKVPIQASVEAKHPVAGVLDIPATKQPNDAAVFIRLIDSRLGLVAIPATLDTEIMAARVVRFRDDDDRFRGARGARDVGGHRRAPDRNCAQGDERLQETLHNATPSVNAY